MELNDAIIQCECGKKMHSMTTLWKEISVRGWRCKSCHEEVLHPLDAQRALEIDRARKKHLLTVKVRRVGKSTVVTVPSSIVAMENLKEGQKIEWTIEGRKLVLLR